MLKFSKNTKGVLVCLDGYMNIALEQTEEYVNGQLKNKYGDAFIRGNNGKIFIVILSFLKRERERFQLFVPRRYCVPARTFLSVQRYNRSPFLTVCIELSKCSVGIP